MLQGPQRQKGARQEEIEKLEIGDHTDSMRVMGVDEVVGTGFDAVRYLPAVVSRVLLLRGFHDEREYVICFILFSCDGSSSSM